MSAVNGYRPVEERNDPPAAPLQNSANKTAQLVCKVFTTLALLGAGATIYTAFWFTAVPSTVIAAFNTSLTTTLVSTVIAFIARQMSANNAQPRVVNQYQPAPQPAANAISETSRPSAPQLAHQDTSAPSAPLVAVREEPAEGSAEAEHARAQKLYTERCGKIEAEYDGCLQAAQEEHRQDLSLLDPMARLLENFKNAELQAGRLRTVTLPKSTEIKQTEDEKKALEKEIALKEEELSESEDRFNKAQELYKKRQKCQGLNREAIEKEIAGCETQIAEAEKPVTGILAAWGARSKDKEAKNRLQVLQGQLASLDEVRGIDPQNLQKELNTLSEKIKDLKLEISPMKRQQTTLGFKLDGYQGQQAEYESLLRARAKRENLLEQIESFKRAHRIIGDLKTFYEQARETANGRFIQAKADLTAWRAEALAAEHKPLAPLNTSID